MRDHLNFLQVWLYKTLWPHNQWKIQKWNALFTTFFKCVCWDFGYWNLKILSFLLSKGYCNLVEKLILPLILIVMKNNNKENEEIYMSRTDWMSSTAIVKDGGGVYYKPR